MSNRTEIIPAQAIAPLIRSIRDQRVILDTDLARLYGVQTFRLNAAVKRNRDRFPPGFPPGFTVDGTCATGQLRCILFP